MKAPDATEGSGAPDDRSGAASANGSVARSLLALIGFVVVVGLVASAGALFTPGTWYAELAKPDWTPPSAIFGPVWTVLYATIAVAGWLAWLRRGGRAKADATGRGATVADRRVRAAFAFYALQLVLNGLWSFLFFGLHRPGVAFIDLMALWIAVLCTVLLFYGIRPLAGILLVPYFAWITFAARLNLAIWRLNG
jgi:tryptophan-rich sensory protein